MSRKGTVACLSCEAEFAGPLLADEDGHPFVETDALHECELCGKDCCRECARKCAGCSMLLCASCQVETDDGRMCPACAALYMLGDAA